MTGFVFQAVPTAAPADAGAHASGAAPRAGAQISAEEFQRRSAQSREIATHLGQLVSLMMRARAYKCTMLAELEWLVTPALVTRQVRIAEGLISDRNIVAPIAAVMWANVSPEVDKRISENPDMPIKLKPEEWRSGDHTWIVEALGEHNAVSSLLQNLKQSELKDRTVRMRIRGADGKITLGRLEVEDAPA